MSFPAIRNLKPARALPLDDDLAVPFAGFDLANVSARAVNLLGDQGRALTAVGFFASRNVFASVDANFCRCGIEVGLKHNCEVKIVQRCTIIMSVSNVHGPLGNGSV